MSGNILITLMDNFENALHGCWGSGRIPTVDSLCRGVEDRGGPIQNGSQQDFATLGFQAATSCARDLNNVATILSRRVSASENIEGLNVIVSLQKSRAILQNLDQYIHQMLATNKNTKIDVPGGIYQIRKRRWLVARRKVITFRKQLCAMRKEMIEVIHLGNLQGQLVTLGPKR